MKLSAILDVFASVCNSGKRELLLDSQRCQDPKRVKNHSAAVWEI